MQVEPDKTLIAEKKRQQQTVVIVVNECVYFIHALTVNINSKKSNASSWP
jgi:hypothetical protein